MARCAALDKTNCCIVCKKMLSRFSELKNCNSLRKLPQQQTPQSYDFLHEWHGKLHYLSAFGIDTYHIRNKYVQALNDEYLEGTDLALVASAENIYMVAVDGDKFYCFAGNKLVYSEAMTIKNKRSCVDMRKPQGNKIVFAICNNEQVQGL